MTGTERKRLWRERNPEWSRKAERERAQARRSGQRGESYQRYEQGGPRLAQRRAYERTSIRQRTRRNRAQVYRERGRRNEVFTLGGKSVVSYKVDILTATKEGFAEFIQALKRAKVAHQTPFEAFVKACSKAGVRTKKTQKAFSQSPDAQPRAYALYVDETVTRWEKRQQQIVEEG
jgi:hypothetical protein